MVDEVLVGPDVAGAQALVRAMDAEGYAPRGALWVHSSETGTWRLWLVPPAGVDDKRAFYLRVATILAKHSHDILIDSGELQFVDASHPAIQGLSRFIRAGGLSSIHLSSSMLNGFLLPDAIILRMDL